MKGGRVVTGTTATEKLEKAIINGDQKGAEEAAKVILETGVNPVEIIEKHLTPTLKIVGDRFEKGEYFLTNLMLSAEAMKAATTILTGSMSEKSKELLRSQRGMGTVVIGTVKGDIHDIGKNVVSMLLEANGITVYDAGKDLNPTDIIKKAEEVKADIIALSALMTVTMTYAGEVINFLKELKLRDKYKVIIGGGPTTQEFADEIGADGWARDASGAVELVRKLSRKKRGNKHD